jgi:hypothetical protein
MGYSFIEGDARMEYCYCGCKLAWLCSESIFLCPGCGEEYSKADIYVVDVDPKDERMG